LFRSSQNNLQDQRTSCFVHLKKPTGSTDKLFRSSQKNLQDQWTICFVHLIIPTESTDKLFRTSQKTYRINGQVVSFIVIVLQDQAILIYLAFCSFLVISCFPDCRMPAGFRHSSCRSDFRVGKLLGGRVITSTCGRIICPVK
jgi:hypothetical protein